MRYPIAIAAACFVLASSSSSHAQALDQKKAGVSDVPVTASGQTGKKLSHAPAASKVRSGEIANSQKPQRVQKPISPLVLQDRLPSNEPTPVTSVVNAQPITVPAAQSTRANQEGK